MGSAGEAFFPATYVPVPVFLRMLLFSLLDASRV